MAAAPNNNKALLTPEVLLSRSQSTVHVLGQKLRHPDLQLADLLQIADKMLEELRTNDLSPKLYYELQLQVLENLHFLQQWFMKHAEQVPLVELYQRVQYSQHAVPRMYLMLTVGVCFLRSTQQQQGAGKDVMRDMLEMCKSVQNPVRGLFLRHYLSQMIYGHIALLGNSNEQVDFLLQNFTEMTKLWTRMVKRDDDASGGGGAVQLGQLVGQNFTRLSEFPLQAYCEAILPRFTQVCTDSVVPQVQSYLLDVLVSSFPVSFHFHALDSMLQLVAGCLPVVRQQALCALLVRFQQVEDGLDEQEQRAQMEAVFAAFSQMFANRQLGGGPLLIKLIELVQQDEVKRLHLFDLASKLDFADTTEIVQVIQLAFSKDTELVSVLQYESIAALFSRLSPASQQSVSTQIVLPRIVNSEIKLDTKTLVDALFRYFTPESLQDAGMVARLLFRFENLENPQELLLIFDLVSEKMQQVLGDEDFKFQITAPLSFRYMQLARRVAAAPRDVLQRVFSMLTTFSEQHMTNSTRTRVCKLFLQLALQADELKEDLVAYECLVSAFTLFEEEADSKARVALVPIMVGTVQQLTSFSKENLDIMQTKVAVYSAQLLRKQDQARSLIQSSTLFWNSVNSRNGKRAFECLQRAGKTCLKDLTIQVDLLNAYISLYQAQADKVKATHISEQVLHIRTLLQQEHANAAVDGYFQRTLLHLRGLAETSPARFADFATVQATRQAEDFM